MYFSLWVYLSVLVRYASITGNKESDNLYKIEGIKEDILVIIKEIADKNSEIKDGAISFIENLAASSIQVRLIAYTTDGTLATATNAKSEIIREIIHRYREEGIEFAFPSLSLYQANTNA